MAQKITIKLVDDIDGSEAVEILKFAVDGVSYELDVSAENAESFRDDLAKWTASARRIGGRRANTKRAASDGPDAKTIRTWALQNGHEVPGRGRIPQTVRDAYVAAH